MKNTTSSNPKNESLDEFDVSENEKNNIENLDEEIIEDNNDVSNEEFKF